MGQGVAGGGDEVADIGRYVEGALAACLDDAERGSIAAAAFIGACSKADPTGNDGMAQGALGIIPGGGRTSTLEAQPAEIELSLVDPAQQAIVIAAVSNRLNPSIGPMRNFTPLWSCSIRLFRYFDERSFVPVGSCPPACMSRTARCDAA